MPTHSAPLRLRDRVGLNVPPLFLRLALGVIFLWAGLGKVSQTIEVSGESAATLANMGVLGPVPAAPSATTKPEPTKPAEATPPETKPAEPKAPEAKPPTPPEPKPETKPGGGTAGRTVGSARIVLVHQQPAPRTFTGADFPAPVPVRSLYMLSLMLKNAAHPGPESGGTMSLWPARLGDGSWPVYLAWAVAITELAGGLCVLLGLLTRLAALGLAGVMIGAMWLTEIGPAIQRGHAVLGFLPDYAAFDGMKWQPLMMQFALCAAALALAFCGPGRLSLDTALLSGGSREDDED